MVPLPPPPALPAGALFAGFAAGAALFMPGRAGLAGRLGGRWAAASPAIIKTIRQRRPRYAGGSCLDSWCTSHGPPHVRTSSFHGKDRSIIIERGFQDAISGDRPASRFAVDLLLNSGDLGIGQKCRAGSEGLPGFWRRIEIAEFRHPVRAFCSERVAWSGRAGHGVTRFSPRSACFLVFWNAFKKIEKLIRRRVRALRPGPPGGSAGRKTRPSETSCGSARDQGLDPGIGVLVAQGEDEVQALVNRLEREVGGRCGGVEDDRGLPAPLRSQGISQIVQEPPALR